MPEIVVLPHAEICPEGKTFEAQSGMSVLDNLLEHDVIVEHACEKSCACTTCHVIVREGFDSLPPSSEDAAAAWRRYIETCIEAFGPERCMFESNFPPDKGQCSYQVIFNAFKRIAAPYSEAEKTALFSKTATEFYRLKLG